MDSGRETQNHIINCKAISNSHAVVWFVLWLIRQWHGRSAVFLLLRVVVSSFADVAKIVTAAATKVQRRATDHGTTPNHRGSRRIIFAKQASTLSEQAFTLSQQDFTLSALASTSAPPVPSPAAAVGAITWRR